MRNSKQKEYKRETKLFAVTLAKTAYMPLISRVRGHRTASYGPSIFPPFMPKHEVHGPWKQARKKRGYLTCRTDRANEVYCIMYMALLIIPVLKRWSRARDPYDYLRTWNWPITAREINLPYNKYHLLAECEVCTVFYGPSFFLPWKQERKKKPQGSIICRTDRASEAIRCILYGFADYSGKGTKSFDVLTGD